MTKFSMQREKHNLFHVLLLMPMTSIRVIRQTVGAGPYLEQCNGGGRVLLWPDTKLCAYRSQISAEWYTRGSTILIKQNDIVIMWYMNHVMIYSFLWYLISSSLYSPRYSHMSVVVYHISCVTYHLLLCSFFSDHLPPPVYQVLFLRFAFLAFFKLLFLWISLNTLQIWLFCFLNFSKLHK